MNGHTPPTAFERNLASLMRASLNQPESDMDERLVHAVIEEVRRQQPARRTHAFRWAAALAVTASVAVAILVYGYLPSRPAGPTGEVRTVYGMVELQTRATRTVANEWTAIPADARIQTRWGSQAEFRLADQSRLLSRTRTTLAIERGRRGERVILDEGWISVEAARQQPGQSLQIQTPGTRISVLGTKFDVHVVQKANGRKQTRVSVASGKVEIESGGQTLLLPPNTEGIAEEGQVPVRRCQTPEVNELLRLSGLGERLAREQRTAPGAPSLIEFHVDGMATVWLIAELKQISQAALSLKTSVREVAAYSMDGVPLDSSLAEQGSRVRLAAPAQGRLILRLEGVKGLFSSEGKGAFELTRAGQDAAVLSLYQIRLPESANIEEIQPKPIETARSLSRQTVTLAVNALPPDLVE